MKKSFTIILLSLLSLNLNLFSVKKEQNEFIRDFQKQQLNEDRIKISFASLGCALFTVAFLLTYNTKILLLDTNIPKFHDPANRTFYVLKCRATLIPINFITKYRLSQNDLISDPTINVVRCLVGFASFASAVGCGSYAYKKLFSTKTDKTVKA